MNTGRLLAALLVSHADQPRKILPPANRDSFTFPPALRPASPCHVKSTMLTTALQGQPDALLAGLHTSVAVEGKTACFGRLYRLMAKLV
jgi:hypothetical protein